MFICDICRKAIQSSVKIDQGLVVCQSCQKEYEDIMTYSECARVITQLVKDYDHPDSNPKELINKIKDGLRMHSKY